MAPFVRIIELDDPPPWLIAPPKDPTLLDVVIDTTQAWDAPDDDLPRNALSELQTVASKPLPPDCNRLLRSVVPKPLPNTVTHTPPVAGVFVLPKPKTILPSCVSDSDTLAVLIAAVTTAWPDDPLPPIGLLRTLLTETQAVLDDELPRNNDPALQDSVPMPEPITVTNVEPELATFTRVNELNKLMS